MEKKKFTKHFSLRNVTVTDDFWKHEMELVRKEVIPYQWKALNDQIEGAAPSFCMRNFALAGQITQKRKEHSEDYTEQTFPTDQIEMLPQDPKHLENRFYGFLFQDSDLYKWIEAVAYSLTQHPDEHLEAIADEAIAKICASQQDNGYLDTFYIINNPKNAFQNLRQNHELYCFGHLTESAVAYYQATGKDALLKAAMHYADYIASVFGEEEGKKKGYPGHEIAEMALASLFEVTGNEQYLKLGKFFVDERGTRPYYFDLESGVTTPPDTLQYDYHQAHLPVREQKEAVGHAVRAVYLYSGMADFARLTEDDSLKEACNTLWQNITQKQMYITGGIGSTHIGEAFTYSYDLPNDTAYAETCASIGLVFFARRMLELEINSCYGDVMERALYNGILSGMALDGKSFFYTNPLSVYPEALAKDERVKHIKPVRQKWFGCACCPPNLARLISSLSSYAFGETDDTIFVHLYVGATLVKDFNGQRVEISLQSGFPYHGQVSLQFHTEKDAKFTIALRIPAWGKQYDLQVKDAQTNECNGYLYITKNWKDGDSLELHFPMEIQKIYANPLVREDIGKVAITRGPIVYCMEEADNGKQLHLLSLPKDCTFTEEANAFEGITLPKLHTTGKRYKLSEDSTVLYSMNPPMKETKEITFIPYYAWANRGEGEMQVFITEEK